MGSSDLPPDLKAILERLEARIEAQLADMTRRIYRIEKQLGIDARAQPAPPAAAMPAAGQPPASAEPEPAPADSVSAILAEAEMEKRSAPRSSQREPDVEPPRNIRISLMEEQPPTAAPITKTKRDWEAIIGGKWTMWTGSVLVILALAFFLAYEWQSFTPVERICIGLAAGLVFLACGELARSRAERWFGESLAGTGLAFFYLTIWAGAQVYPILSFRAAFFAMCAVTAAGAALSLLHDSPSLSALATIGGFLTPFFLHMGDPALTLAYAAALDAGILVISLFKRWTPLLWISFVATSAIFANVLFFHSIESQKPVYFGFVTIYYLMFFGAACFYSLIRGEETTGKDLTLFFAATSFYAAAVYALHLPSRFPAGFPLCLALFFALMSAAAHFLARENRLLKGTLLGAAVFFFTIAIPMQLHQSELAIGWSVEAAILITLGLRYNSPVLLRQGEILWAISSGLVVYALMVVEPSHRVLFLNERALPLLVAVAANGWMAIYSRRRADTPGDGLAPLYAAAAAAGGAWLIAQETQLGFSWSTRPTPATWEAAALFSIAAGWGIYSAALFLIGLITGDEIFRAGGLTVAALAYLLPVLVTETHAAGGWTPFWNFRALSFLILSLSAGSIGYLMSRNAGKLERAEIDLSRAFTVMPPLIFIWGVTVELYALFSAGGADPESWRPAALFAVATLWSLAAVILYMSGIRREKPEARGLSLFLMAAAAGVTMYNVSVFTPEGWTPFVNARFLTFAALTLSSAAIFRLMGKNRGRLTPAEKSLLIFTFHFAVCASLAGLTLEIFAAFRWFGAARLTDWPSAAWFTAIAVWSAYSAALVSSGFHRSRRSSRGLGVIVAAVAAAAACWISIASPLGDWVIHLRFAAFAALTMSLVFSASRLEKNREKLQAGERGLAFAFASAAMIAGLWGLTQETYGVAYLDRARLGEDWARDAQMAVSVVWVLCGSALFACGALKRSRVVRRAAFVLLGLTVVKLLLLDLRFLPNPERFFSFGIGGIALIAISLANSRLEKRFQRGEST